MQEEFGRWLAPEQKCMNLCFSNFVVPANIGSSIEQHGGGSAVISSDKEFSNSLIIENGHESNQGVDLNKTHPEKPKRKKHRPKVIRERKPKTTTPKSSTDKEKPSGKRKYVRRKGLNSAANQPSVEVVESHSRAEPKPVRRCLKFDGENFGENGCPGTSSTSKDSRDSHAQETCNLAGTTSLISSSADLVTSARELLQNNVPKAAMLDLNSSIYQIQSECISAGQNLRPCATELSSTNQLMDFCSHLPGKNIYDLNSSVNQMQRESNNFADHLSLSPQTFTREAITTNQMLNGFNRIPENTRTSFETFEEDLIRENSDILSGRNDYLKYTTSTSRPIEASFSYHNACNISDLLAIGTHRDHNVVSAAHASIDKNLNQAYSARDFVRECQVASSEVQYFPETYKRMRTENQMNWANRVAANFSSSSSYTPSMNRSYFSAINSPVSTLADAQRLVALEKSQASQRILASEFAGRDTVKRPNQSPQPYFTSLLDATKNDDHLSGLSEQFTYINTERTQMHTTAIRPLSEKNNLSENCQLQHLESNRTKRANLLAQLHNTSPLPNSDYVATSDQQFRCITTMHAQFRSTPTSMSTAEYNTKCGNFELQSSEDNMTTRSNLSVQLHNSSLHDTANAGSTARTDKHLGSISELSKLPNAQTSPSPGTEKPTEKPKAKRRPRKEKTGSANPVSSKIGHAGELKNEYFCSDSRPAEMTHGAKAMASGRNGEKLPFTCASSNHEDLSISSSKQAHGESIISEVIAPFGDQLDVLILKMKCLCINKADKSVATKPQNALVPYKQEIHAMVPYDGTIQLPKKRRSRAKVDLDPVTNVMWKFLMGESDSVEGMDKEKEIWLEEERRIFWGRIDSFIARMHLVQGDRRFSPWKGSVVDSVVGVFLTQNVSDHLSSSAFMALAAKFPVKLGACHENPRADTSVQRKDTSVGPFGDVVKWQGKFSTEEVADIGSLLTTEEKEGSNSNESFGSNSGDRVLDSSAARQSQCYGRKPTTSHQSGAGTLITAVGSAIITEDEDRTLEDVVSSQNSAASTQNFPDCPIQMTDELGSGSFSNFTAEEFIRKMSNSMDNPTSYTELLWMQDMQSKSSEWIGFSEHSGVSLLPIQGMDKRMPHFNQVDNLNNAHLSFNDSLSYLHNGNHDFLGMHVNHMDNPNTAPGEMNEVNAVQAAPSVLQSSSASGIVNKDKSKMTDASCGSSCCIDEFAQKNSSFPSECTAEANWTPTINHHFQLLTSPDSVACTGKRLFCQRDLSSNEIEAPLGKLHNSSNLRDEHASRTEQKGGEEFQQGCSKLVHDCQLKGKTVGNPGFSNLDSNQCSTSEVLAGVSPNLTEKTYGAQKGSCEVESVVPKTKKVKAESTRQKTYDWDSLRKEVCRNDRRKGRSYDAMDSIDWEAVRSAEVSEISETIRERGMNNVLAERIKEFLNRVLRDHGSIDLEWLRDVDPDKAKDYLLSIRGIGLKSVECVRLLTLHHLAFPVDTNVGRICVRLGWVPLQPLPESLQLHLLELYPMLENIQKYLWPRLCKLDQRTLYELHYQMITFGKVFCTKTKPNCNACPMRAECKHFASAFASARLALPGPEEKSLVTTAVPIASESGHQPYMNSRPAVQLEWSTASHELVDCDNHQPIIEEPATPEAEPASTDVKEAAIEDAFGEDPDEIPTIKLNFDEFTQNLRSYMQANNIEIEDDDMSKALVALTPEAASIPTPKLKYVSRLRTEHQVYELPDSHPLLEGFEQREPDDPCPYLLSIWTPGETAQSTEVPEAFCNSQETGELCQSMACFSCSSIREVQAQKVRGTLLIPCRTAMRGSFPLNGTYFQVNEVFADHVTSQNPIDVPRSWIWNLPRRTVYFGTSIPTIFKGLTTEDIQHCFWRGFVCVRGFDRTTRAPRPLYARLHFPASKAIKNKKKAAGSAAAREEQVL